jgi:hypothetical protein
MLRSGKRMLVRALRRSPDGAEKNDPALRANAAPKKRLNFVQGWPNVG